MPAISRLLIANRGEVALRILRAARHLGMSGIAVYSDADAHSTFVREADAAMRLGGAAPADSYLSAERILDAATRVGADAVHPGYGFLSENAKFARACTDAGLVFVGPDASAIEVMGNKAVARQRVAADGVACLPGYDGEDDSDEALLAAANILGYPLMVKAAAGGGGRGMRLVHQPDRLPQALVAARAEARHAFGDGRLLLERALARPRHIEVQVLADRHGNTVHLGERECSIQRRHQKLIEESPSPAVDEVLRERMGAAAVRVARMIGYSSLGTVEFLVDSAQPGSFYFMEMNTRLQVEHAVTEAVTGLDLVELQLRVAQGESLTTRLPGLQADVHLQGHAIEARLCAEDPGHDFLPVTGVLARWRAPPGVRCDHALESGQVISPWYDSLLAKVIAHAASRDDARVTLANALDQCVTLGIVTNRTFLAGVVRDAEFGRGDLSTAFIEERFPVDTSRRPAPGLAPWSIAAALASFPPRPAGCPMASELHAWTSTGVAIRPIRLEYQGAERRATAIWRRGGVISVHWDESGETCDVQFASAAGGESPTRVLVEGVATWLDWMATKAHIHLQFGGVDYSFGERSLASVGRSHRDAPGDRVEAPINGRVVQVHRQAGDLIEPGCVIIVLEAMKMEHPILAHSAGRVAEILVTVGEQVEPGRLLARLEPA